MNKMKTTMVTRRTMTKVSGTTNTHTTAVTKKITSSRVQAKSNR